MSALSITPRQLREACDTGGNVALIDVRTPIEFHELHLSTARNIPLSRLDASQIQSNANSISAPATYVICHSGFRGQQACQKLRSAGLANVFNVEGGTVACLQSGLFVVEGKRSMALERQVRIAAGSMVFLGSLAGAFIHPAFLAIPAFAGAGLVVSGVTNWCGLGMMIARLPWNQTGSPA